MKILHTSDLHLGLRLHDVSFLEIQRDMTAQLIKIAEDNKIEVMMICGDVFDRAVSSSGTIALYDEMCTKLCLGLGIKVLICAGNHDGAARLAACGELLKESGLYIAGRISDCSAPLVTDDAVFHFMPYFNTDEARALFPDEDIKNYTDAVRAVINMRETEITEGKKNIILAHLFVAGSETCESDRSAVAGSSAAVPAGLFDKFDYAALGHLHKAQTIKNARYSGTPLKYSFAEVNHKKSVTIIDTETMEITTEEIKPLIGLRCISGTYDEVTAIAANDSDDKDFIKIELTDRYPTMEISKAFREKYPNLLLCTGKSFVSENAVTSISMSEISSLSIEEILAKYCGEVAGIELDDELTAWFGEAVEEYEKGSENI